MSLQTPVRQACAPRAVEGRYILNSAASYLRYKILGRTGRLRILRRILRDCLSCQGVLGGEASGEVLWRPVIRADVLRIPVTFPASAGIKQTVHQNCGAW